MADPFRVLRTLAAAGVLLLAGCPSGEYESASAFCNSFGNGATFSWGTCTNCTVTDPARVSDRDLYTASGITPGAGQTGDSVTLTATAAADFPSGATVGVWVTQPNGLTSTVNSFRTVLNGVEQETSNSQNLVVEYSRGGTQAAGFIGMRTTKGFDVVEFTTTNTWNSGQTPVYYVYEICSDGGNA